MSIIAKLNALSKSSTDPDKIALALSGGNFHLLKTLTAETHATLVSQYCVIFSVRGYPLEWYPVQIQDWIFTIPLNQCRNPMYFGMNWAVMLLKDYEHGDLPPFEIEQPDR